MNRFQEQQVLKKEVIDYIGKKYINHLYKTAQVNHCLPIKQVTQELINRFNIPYNKINERKATTPSIWDIGKVYYRLISDLSTVDNWLDKLFEVYNSWICDYIDDYQKPIYWQSRSYLKECYLENKIL